MSKVKEKAGNSLPTTASGSQLVKDSTPEQMKAYFSKVLELTKSGKEFPVNLDDVWPLAYRRKEEAVRVLKKDFVKDVDFQALRRNAERGAASPIDYYLSTFCLEYFVAKRVKPVFEVYRQVFHWTMNQQALIPQTTRLRPELAIPDAIPNYNPNYIFPVDYVKIGNDIIGRSEINAKFYYQLPDIHKAAKMKKNRSQLQLEFMRKVAFKIRTLDKGKLIRVMSSDGIVALLRRSRSENALSFLESFLEFTEDIVLEVDKSRKEFIKCGILDVVKRTDNEKDRGFLIDLFNLVTNSKGGAV